MKILSIDLSGYRSFAKKEDHKSYFTLDSNIIALIGRNGVGKTNALEAISRLRFFTDDVDNAIPVNAINQNIGGTPELSICAELDDADVKVLAQAGLDPLLEERDVVYVWRYDLLERKTKFEYHGAFFEILRKHPELKTIDADLKELAGYLSEKVQVNFNNWEYPALIHGLLEYDKCYVSRLGEIVKWAKQTLPNYLKGDVATKLVPLLEHFQSVLTKVYGVFAEVSPHICKFDDTAEFPNACSLDDLLYWNQNNRLPQGRVNALVRFLGAIGFSWQQLIDAMQLQNDQVRIPLRDRISNEARRLSKRFNHWYMDGKAEFELNVNFDGKMLRFTVNLADIPASVMWSGANAGLRWYFSAFLELERALRHRNVIILVDEPANHLHVDAQDEALKLLRSLAKDTTYVVYTTHSPFMLDKDRLGDVRAVVREGYVSAIRPLTAVEDVDCRHEVLAPVFHSLGCSMSAGLISDATRMNVIVEGITDHIYLNAMMDVLGMDESERFHVIPCQGAPSVPYVVPLFIGWGLPFKVLLDGDGEGDKAHKRIRDAYGAYVDVRSLIWQGNGCPIEGLISKADYKRVCGDKLNADDYRQAKTVKARRFAALAKSDKSFPDKDTRAACGCLFEQLSKSIEPAEIDGQDAEVEA